MSALPKPDQSNSKPGKRKSNRVMMILFFVFTLTVCLYLARLEAFTRSDLFLPLNYHSGFEKSGTGGTAWEPADPNSVADVFLTYYQQYADQEGRPYTIRQDLLLSRLAYIHAPMGFRGETEGITVLELCNALERILDDPSVDAERLLGRNRSEILAVAHSIKEHSHLGELIICDYIADPSGLAGYVFERDGEITMALRGTDDVIDQLDNVLLLPFNLSVQYAAMRELLDEYGSAQRIWLTGHSKGGHNAIYAASMDPRCRATGFNAPGFGIFLSDAQHDGLDFGVNYVINGDITGFLLFHLERRIILESSASTAIEGLSNPNKHRLDNFFSIDDLAIAPLVEPKGIWIEWITQILWLLLLYLAGYAMLRLFREAFWRIIKTKPPLRQEEPDPR